MIWRELRRLVRHSAIYGLADVLPYVVNFFLLRVFTKYLTRADYGALGILLLFGVLTKIFFRMGLDAGFFRIYYEQTTDRDRKTLATTLFWTAFAVSLALLVGAALFARFLGSALIGADLDPATTGRWILLVAGDTFLNTFAFVPMNLFRMKGRPQAFTAMTLLRSFLNIGLKLALVVGGYGVTGVLLSDVISSALFVLALAPTLVDSLVPAFSWPMLRASLGFGLPKVPHGLAHQILNLSDRKLIEIYLGLAPTGLYHIGYMMGTGVKFFLSAFELAWAPFVYSKLSGPDAPSLIARIATYAFATLFGFGLLNAVFGRELLFLMAEPEFHAAAPVIPVVVLAYMMQGVFALTSIGIGISKKSGYFPMMTFAAAGLNVALNVAWIPRFGLLGAAWATVAGYFLMAALGVYLGRKHYPIPFEWGRMLRVVVASGLAFAASLLAPEAIGPALGVKAFAVLLYPTLLLLSGFFLDGELSFLRSWMGRPQPGQTKPL